MYRPLKSCLIIISLLCLTGAANAAPAPLAFDLVENLPLAHRYRDGVLVDGASVSSLKYLRDKRRLWQGAVEVGGEPSLLPAKLSAHFWIPILGHQQGEQVLDALVYPLGRGQRVDVFVNGTKIAHEDFSETRWHSLRYTIPAELLGEGIARVRFHFRRRVEHQGVRTPAAFRALRIGAPSVDPLPTTGAPLNHLFRYKAGDTLRLPARQGVDFYLPSTGALVFQGRVTRGTVTALVQRDGRAPEPLGESSGAFSFPLQRFGVGGLRLILRSKGGPAQLTGRITGAEEPTRAQAPARPKNVLFWLIDTLRADKLSFYPYENANQRPHVHTPNLSAFAQEATIFAPFYVQGNESKASHASLFTGTYPVRHGVFNHAAQLPDELLTIAEALRRDRLRTSGFVSNGYVSDRWNFDQGFQDFKNFIREGLAHNARAVSRAAKRWLKRRGRRPFYLYLGTSDPHVTYRRHDDLIGRYDRGTYNGRYRRSVSGAELGRLKQRSTPPSERDQARVEALYENEIEFNDRYFGQVLDQLRELGVYDETLIIVSADHGDEFWEHGSCGHGHSLHQELVEVPLLIRWPGGSHAQRWAGGAEGVDLLPTLLEVFGRRRPRKLQGRSLIPFLNQPNPYPQAVIASQGHDSYTLAAGPAKVIFRGPGLVKSFHRIDDHGERQDLSDTHPVLTLSALDPLLLFIRNASRWSKTRWGSPNALLAGFPRRWADFE